MWDIILNFHQVTHVSLIQNENYQQSPEKTKNKKCDHPFLCEFPISFSTVKLKLGHNFFQFIRRFKIWILKCWSWTVYTSKFFSIHKMDGKLDSLKA